MKKLCFILLLLLSGLNVWASTVYTYPASADDPSTGVIVEIEGTKATVTLYKSDALANNQYPPSAIPANLPWGNVNEFYFVSDNDEAIYSSEDWNVVLRILNYAPSQLSLDFSSMIIDDSNFTFENSASKTKLSYVKMPNGLVKLKKHAFLNCSNLSAIGWSPNLKEIGEAAFHQTAFTSITIPEGVTKIGDQAFYGCTNLTTISLPESLLSVGVDILDSCPQLTAIHSHNKTAPKAEGDICDNTGWSLLNDEFAFYSKCILYIQPNADTYKSYCSSPYWCKFFIDGSAKICLHTYDLNRPLVTGEQKLEVKQPNVAPTSGAFDSYKVYTSEDGTIVVEISGLPETFYKTYPINTIYFRDMTKLKWYTIMLPFDVKNNIVKSVFGEGTKIMGYSGIHDNTLCFEEAKDVIKANVPYLIKPGNTESDYEFDGTTISYSEILGPTEISALGANTSYNQYDSEFVGTYCNKQIPVYAYYLKSDKFYYMPSENTKKGWKAYGGVVMINASAVEGGSVAAHPSATYLDINLDADMPTGIDSPTSVAIGSQSLDGPIYTLSGQQVKNPGKGIYIRNGKKFIIK